MRAARIVSPRPNPPALSPAPSLACSLSQASHRQQKGGCAAVFLLHRGTARGTGATRPRATDTPPAARHRARRGADQGGATAEAVRACVCVVGRGVMTGGAVGVVGMVRCGEGG